MMCHYISRPLYQIFTQSIDAIDVTNVTLSCLNSINAIILYLLAPDEEAIASKACANKFFSSDLSLS